MKYFHIMNLLVFYFRQYTSQRHSRRTSLCMLTNKNTEKLPSVCAGQEEDIYSTCASAPVRGVSLSSACAYRDPVSQSIRSTTAPLPRDRDVQELGLEILLPETQPQSEPSALRSASTRCKEEFLDSIANAEYIVKKEVTFDVTPLEVNSQISPVCGTGITYPRERLRFTNEESML